MDVKLKENVTIADLVNEYTDNMEEGVLGYGKTLNIRPPYQREFIYNLDQREAVIDTVLNGFPLNTMYWIKNKGKNTFELIDGQQRTISICQYVNDDFSCRSLYFTNQQEDKKKQILEYKLMVYTCEGTDSERLAWFKTINIAGEKLTNQELRNAIYSGSWVTNAKLYFSKINCPAQYYKRYLTGSSIRQDYLERAIRWASKGNIEDYMGLHQHEESASSLWDYFEKVMGWVKSTFTKYRKEMKGVDWGELYHDFNDQTFNPKEIEEEIEKLFLDDDVTNKKGIYPYVLTRNTKYLNIRSFTKSQKSQVYAKQGQVCNKCKKEFDQDDMEADHIKPWCAGGSTSIDNCQMLCKKCNREKSGK
ncbi:HNH endonuclease family protein [Candidatus Liberibacter brunswickensis]|uniref:HNH endonuclease family protein n=1 Tax=Candidatus Liberibacter brunswickensis TaxID=1968796 RepID=UPI002FE0A983